MPVGRNCSSGFFHQEVVENETHGTVLRAQRQKLTGDAPSWCVGRGRSGQPANATLLAGATNVAPSQLWGWEEGALVGR